MEMGHLVKSWVDLIDREEQVPCNGHARGA
jgi:hypothetical protein